MKMAVLGIDTSNYRTSLCVIDEHYQVLFEENPLLEVKDGQLGLQQSVALFQHLKTWPLLLQKMTSNYSIKAVGVSIKPRPVQDSYMPVFLAGEVLAETIAHFLCVPVYKTSHQEGHIAAGEYSAKVCPQGDAFIAVHLSGGTSEVLICQRDASKGGYQIECLGRSLDLHAGQFVDRVGVRLGLPFPAGPHLESLARQVDKHTELPIIPSYTRGVDFSFSGPTTHALRLIETGHYQAAALARAVENTISKTLEKSLKHAIQETGLKEIILVGGVASNQYITTRLEKRLLKHDRNIKLYLASPTYATDNAYGVACLALNRLKHSKRIMEG